MMFKGYKIRVRCKEWEQIEEIDKFWNVFTNFVDINKIVGLGMNWSKDLIYFDYAIGTINNENVLDKIRTINFSKAGFIVDYIEAELPPLNEWVSFSGKTKNVKYIYENQIDIIGNYDYELEYLDYDGNIEIKIHFI